MGVQIKCLDPSDVAPASVAARHVRGHFRDAVAIDSFVRQEGVSVLTMEIEHIDADALELSAQHSGIDVEPSPSTIRTIQDKYLQKVRGGVAGREARCMT